MMNTLIIIWKREKTGECFEVGSILKALATFLHVGVQRGCRVNVP
jgi:hypothetical protein